MFGVGQCCCRKAGKQIDEGEENDVYMTHSSYSVLNVVCPVSGMPVVNLEDPVRRFPSLHNSFPTRAANVISLEIIEAVTAHPTNEIESSLPSVDSSQDLCRYMSHYSQKKQVSQVSVYLSFWSQLLQRVCDRERSLLWP